MARIRAERETTLLGDMMDSWYPEICSAVPEARLDDAFRAPFVSDVPTLFLAGTLDANTPPWQAFQVSWGWPHATVLVVDRAGHEALMPWAPAQEVIVDFFRGEDVSGRRLELPALAFVPVEEVRSEQQRLAALRRGLRGLIIGMALLDGRVGPEERAVAAGVYEELLGQRLDDEALDAAVRAVAQDARSAADHARDLAGYLSDEHKALALLAALHVARADGDADPGEERLLHEIGMGLGMSPDAIREVLSG